MRILNKRAESSMSLMNSQFTGKSIQGKSKEEVWRDLGQFVEVVARDERRQNINIASFLYWVKPAILHNQYLFFYDEGEIEPTGYVLWAWADEKTLFNYLSSDKFILHPMCWNEGVNLIVIDFVCLSKLSTPAILLKLYRQLKTKVGISYLDVNVCIRNSKGSVVKHNRKYAYEQNSTNN